MSLASLEAFLARLPHDPELREILAEAPDAAAVAAIARAAGYPVSELDLWRATAASPDELPPAAQPSPPAAEPPSPAAEPPPLAGRATPSAERPTSSPDATRLQARAATPKALAGVLPDPWWEEEPLQRFVHQAQGDEELRQALASAPDAAAVASIAQAAGYPISEVDLWLASGTTPDELAASLRPAGNEGSAMEDSAGEDDFMAGEEPVGAGVSADEGLSIEALPPRAGDRGAEGAAVSANQVSSADQGSSVGDGCFADKISFPFKGSIAGKGSFARADSWLEDHPGVAEDPSAGGAPLAEEGGSGDDLNPRAAAEEAIRQLLRQAEADAALRQALTQAADASAVAAIAQAAGHPISELALWLASGAAFEEVRPVPEPPSLEKDPLTSFLRAVEVDPDLQIALASAPDAVCVAAIARIAGFPLTAADLWAASDAVPQELLLEELIFAEGVGDDMLVVMDGGGA